MIDRQNKLEVNRTKNNHLASKKPHKWLMAISQLGFFQRVRHSKLQEFKRQTLCKKPDIEVDILKNVSKMDNFRPEIGQLPL